jgi:hypothetical protein
VGGSRRSKAKARSGGIEDAIVGIQEDISINVLGSASDRLDTTEARAALRCGGEIDQRAGNSSHVVANGEGEIGESSVAAEDIPAITVGCMLVAITDCEEGCTYLWEFEAPGTCL